MPRNHESDDTFQRRKRRRGAADEVEFQPNLPMQAHGFKIIRYEQQSGGGEVDIRIEPEADEIGASTEGRVTTDQLRGLQAIQTYVQRANRARDLQKEVKDENRRKRLKAMEQGNIDIASRLRGLHE